MAHRTRQWLALTAAMVFPSLVTWTYFVLLARQPAVWQQVAYAVGKTIQFAFPLFWVSVVLGQTVRRQKFEARGIGSGLGFGALVLATGLGLYHGWLKPQGVFSASTVAVRGPTPDPSAETARPAMTSPADAVRSKIQGFGVDRWWKYAALGIFYSLIHSLLEEYYWRWFVFGRLRDLLPTASAVGLSSLAFMAHHVLVMAVYFGWASPWTYGFSLAVAVGGAFWAWLYARSGSLYGPWFSHLLIDAAIFLVGFDLVKDLL
jgi:uncharacterized protein